MTFDFKDSQTNLRKYIVAATLARASDGGAVIAIILFVTKAGGSTFLAGILGACLTAPHLFGPFLARQIDLANDSRKVIAMACYIYSGALVLFTLTFSFLPHYLAAIFLIIAGVYGSFLTGGISSRLPALIKSDQHNQRSAQGWDIATYGIGGAIGPAVVVFIVDRFGPSFANFTLSFLTIISAFFIMKLPYSTPEHNGNKKNIPTAWHTIKLMISNQDLLFTLSATVIVAYSVSALPIIAIHIDQFFNISTFNTAILISIYGIGNLIGSILLMKIPLKGSPIYLMHKYSISIAIGLFLILFINYQIIAIIVFLVLGILNSFFFGATLAARAEYSPPLVRSQVFLWVAALKITAGAIGVAIAGALIDESIYYPVIFGIILIILSNTVFLISRKNRSKL